MAQICRPQTTQKRGQLFPFVHRKNFARIEVLKQTEMRTIRPLLAACCLLAAGACHSRAERSLAFTQSLRCGMTRAEVTRLAHEKGYDDADQSWLTRTVLKPSSKSKQLSFVDLTFRRDSLVAFRVCTYVRATKRIEYRNVDLCSVATAAGPSR